MIAKHLLAALVAGIIAGILVTFAQQAKVVPLILEAEVYEKAPEHHHTALTPKTGFSLVTPAMAEETATPPAKTEEPAMAGHDHEAATADPENGMLFGVSRMVGTLMANLISGSGFALIMAAASLLLAKPVTLQNGVLWGAAGWCAFFLIPGLGLPPELPGFPVADLEMRQMWWVSAVSATGVGLYFMVLRREIWAKIIGFLIMLAPLAYGAPQPDTLETNVPAPLAAEYAMAAMGTGLFFWIALGLLMGAIGDRFLRPA